MHCIMYKYMQLLKEILYIRNVHISVTSVCPSMLGVYANFTCPTNSRCEGGRCRCNRGWMGEDCDMRELSCAYTDQHCWVQRKSAHTHSHLSIAPFCNAAASNTCGPYNLTCHNNGRCISMYTGNGTYTYSCLCRPSFTGADCSQQLPSELMIRIVLISYLVSIY